MITVSKDRYLITGGIDLLGKKANSLKLIEGTYAFCRCGESNNKLFCDGFHNKINLRL